MVIKNIETNHTNPRLEFSEDSFDQTYVVVSKVVSFVFFFKLKKKIFLLNT